MDIDELSPDQKILLAVIDGGGTREAMGFLCWKAKGDGYQSRPHDMPIAVERWKQEMPQCFKNDEEILSPFEAWKRAKNAAAKGAGNGY
jgi:hypothetical protein